ncbi:MAG: hypothetical protein COA68_12080 [Oceanobacter sp.]|nr:MAG: hypothetical protein COA68_12080 [Oceanobacter sp.]
MSAAGIQFTSLPRASRQARDIVGDKLSPLFATLHPAEADAWKRRVLVLCARELHVVGSSLAALTLNGDAITAGIAAVLALALPDVSRAVHTLTDALAEAEREYGTDRQPPTDFSPLPSRTPSPSPVPPAPAAPTTPDPALLAAIASMGTQIGIDVARAISDSFARTHAASPPAAPQTAALERTLMRHMEEQKEFVSSIAPAEDEPLAPLLRALPFEYRWPKAHDDTALFCRAIGALARAFREVSTCTSVSAHLGGLARELRASARDVPIDLAAALQLYTRTQDATTGLLLSVAELAILADRTLPTHTLSILRLARVARPRSVAEVTAARRGEYVACSDLDYLPIADKKPGERRPKGETPHAPASGRAKGISP